MVDRIISAKTKSSHHFLNEFNPHLFQDNDLLCYLDAQFKVSTGAGQEIYLQLAFSFIVSKWLYMAQLYSFLVSCIKLRPCFLSVDKSDKLQKKSKPTANEVGADPATAQLVWPNLFCFCFYIRFCPATVWHQSADNQRNQTKLFVNIYLNSSS